jgi:hypothetical protein
VGSGTCCCESGGGGVVFRLIAECTCSGPLTGYMSALADDGLKRECVDEETTYEEV